MVAGGLAIDARKSRRNWRGDNDVTHSTSALCGEAADEGIARNGCPIEPPQGRDQLLLLKPKIGTGLAQTRWFLFLSTRGATRSPQRSPPCVGYLVQHVLHARRLR